MPLAGSGPQADNPLSTARREIAVKGARRRHMIPSNDRSLDLYKRRKLHVPIPLTSRVEWLKVNLEGYRELHSLPRCPALFRDHFSASHSLSSS